MVVPGLELHTVGRVRKALPPYLPLTAESGGVRLVSHTLFQ